MARLTPREVRVGFSRNDFRPGMDVYTKDNQYLGAIVAVVPGSSGGTTEQVVESARQSGTVSGESMGPMPTASSKAR